MNKKRVDAWLERAYDALIKSGIADKNLKINKTFRGQISSFGAAVVTGSFKSALAFFLEQGGASVERYKLISAMDYVINSEKTEVDNAKTVFENVCRSSDLKDMKAKFIDASIAIKLAMNLFELKD
ncbi:MAG: hypothetical protein IKA02_03785 [Clostridia bacterium]|nr:hypothetical protein [Clostridia bacterium]